MRFGKKSKLSLRFTDPYEVIEKLGSVAYRVTPKKYPIIFIIIIYIYIYIYIFSV